MLAKTRDNADWRMKGGLLFGVVAMLIVAGPGMADEQSEIQEELRFASELVKWRFPDYAQKTVDRLLVKYPAAKAQAAKVRIETLTSRGKFAEAEALVKTMPVGAPETMVMQLAIADQYYAWQKMKDAQRVYDDFFKQFPQGPPAEVARLYGESAYKFSQMLLLSGDYPGALAAYRRVLTCPLNSSDIERRVQTEMAEVALRVAELPATDPAVKKQILQEAVKTCEKIQWKGMDLWFAKSVVILAHVKLLQGDRVGARKTIADYMPMLVEVDKILREAKESKLSPMAECKFMLGTLYEEEGRALVEAAKQDAEKKAGCVNLLAQGMTQLYTVAKNFPGSSWAPTARRRADGIADVLEKDLGKTVTRPVFDDALMMDEQLKEARLLFQQQDFKTAAEKFQEVLNIEHKFKRAPWVVSEMARCYVELKDDPYARAMTGFLAERFSQGTNAYEDAGNALLAVATAYDERREWLKAGPVYDLYYRYYPEHSKVPYILFRQGESAVRSTNYVDALQSYRKITENYPKARVYPEALSRTAYCLMVLDDPTNAIPVLTNYIAQLSTGVEMLSARLRLADAYRSTGMTVPALNEYSRLLKSLEQDSAALAQGSADEGIRLKRMQEVATYSKAQSYSRLREPADQLPVYQAKAIEGYEAFMKGFPKSDLAPGALGAMGTLYYLLGKPDEASKAFDRLKREYPNSQQAMNIVFVQADALMNMGEKSRAVKVYTEMLNNTANFKAPEFLRAARVLFDAKEFDVSSRLFAEARKSTEVPVWQAATLGYGQALSGAGKYDEAVKSLEDFLEKYKKSGYVIDVNLILSRCYAEMAKKEADPKKAKVVFDKALGAMSKVRQYARDPEMMIKADIEMAAIQLLMGEKMAALASYQKVLLFADPSNLKLRPHIEQAFDSVLPLFRETARYADMQEACETYLKQFPQGLYNSKARQGRDEAKTKLATGR